MSLRRILLSALVGTCLISGAGVATAAPVTPGSLPELRERSPVMGAVLTKGGKVPYPSRSVIHSRTGLTIAPNGYHCSPRLGTISFFRAPDGRGLTVLSRGPRLVARVDLDYRGAVIAALHMRCDAPARPAR